MKSIFRAQKSIYTTPTQFFILISCLSLILLFTGCKRSYEDFYPYSDQGVKKPAVVVLPLVISPAIKQASAPDAMMSLYRAMYSDLCRRGTLYMPRYGSLMSRLERLDERCITPIWSTQQIPWLRLRPFNYIAAIELIDCSFMPYDGDSSLEEKSKAMLLTCILRVALFERKSDNEGKLIRLETVQRKMACSKRDAFEEDPLRLFHQPGSVPYRMISWLARDSASYIESSIILVDEAKIR